MKKLIATLAVIGAVAGCTDAQIVSQNISKAADQFEINRRIVFLNGITDTYLLSIEGLCSIRADRQDVQLEVTCKVGPKTYKKHFLGLSDNVTYFAEQLEDAPANAYRYRVIFKPATIIPDIELKL